MTLLLDQNLSFKLVYCFTMHGMEAVHVSALGMSSATDEVIRMHARQHKMVIVSKDSDFMHYAYLYGHPPKIIWLRVGNASTQMIANHIKRHIDIIRTFVDISTESVLVL